jgi:hypothetical protein
MNFRFAVSMAVYAVLALLATFTLEGDMRTAIWILMAGLAAKTAIAWRARW